jgi:hypothetical protein
MPETAGAASLKHPAEVTRYTTEKFFPRFSLEEKRSPGIFAGAYFLSLL